MHDSWRLSSMEAYVGVFFNPQEELTKFKMTKLRWHGLYTSY
jgi:hypothetical protein